MIQTDWQESRIEPFYVYECTRHVGNVNIIEQFVTKDNYIIYTIDMREVDMTMCSNEDLFRVKKYPMACIGKLSGTLYKFIRMEEGNPSEIYVDKENENNALVRKQRRSLMQTISDATLKVKRMTADVEFTPEQVETMKRVLPQMYMDYKTGGFKKMAASVTYNELPGLLAQLAKPKVKETIENEPLTPAQVERMKVDWPMCYTTYIQSGMDGVRRENPGFYDLLMKDLKGL